MFRKLLNLYRGIAILRYLGREFNIDNKLYPRDSIAQAKIDEYLEWQHAGIRMSSVRYIQSKFRGIENPKFKESMIKAFEDFERLWLGRSLYLTGNQVNIADIFAACELEQPRLFGYNPADGRPALSQWLMNVRRVPYYEEVHSKFNALTENKS